jgi:hypothetical protein
MLIRPARLSAIISCRDKEYAERACVWSRPLGLSHSRPTYLRNAHVREASGSSLVSASSYCQSSQLPTSASHLGQTINSGEHLPRLLEATPVVPAPTNVPPPQAAVVGYDCACVVTPYTASSAEGVRHWRGFARRGDRVAENFQSNAVSDDIPTWRLSKQRFSGVLCSRPVVTRRWWSAWRQGCVQLALHRRRTRCPLSAAIQKWGLHNWKVLIRVTPSAANSASCSIVSTSELLWTAINQLSHHNRLKAPKRRFKVRIFKYNWFLS